MGTVSGSDRYIKVVFYALFDVGHCRGLIEASVVAAAATQFCDAVDGVAGAAWVKVGAEDLTSQVGEVEEVRYAIEVHIHYRDPAGYCPFHVGVGCAPDEGARFGIDDVDGVAHLIGCFAALMVVMVLGAVAATENQRGYRSARGRHTNEGRGGPGLTQPLEAGIAGVDLPFEFRAGWVGYIQRVEVLASAAHAAIEVNSFRLGGYCFAGLAPGCPAGIQAIKLTRVVVAQRGTIGGKAGGFLEKLMRHESRCFTAIAGIYDMQHSAVGRYEYVVLVAAIVNHQRYAVHGVAPHGFKAG